MLPSALVGIKILFFDISSSNFYILIILSFSAFFYSIRSDFKSHFKNHNLIYQGGGGISRKKHRLLSRKGNCANSASIQIFILRIQFYKTASKAGHRSGRLFCSCLRQFIPGTASANFNLFSENAVPAYQTKLINNNPVCLPGGQAAGQYHKQSQK